MKVKVATLATDSMKAYSCPWCGSKTHPILNQNLQECNVCGEPYVTSFLKRKEERWRLK